MYDALITAAPVLPRILQDLRRSIRAAWSGASPRILTRQPLGRPPSTNDYEPRGYTLRLDLWGIVTVHQPPREGAMTRVPGSWQAVREGWG